MSQTAFSIRCARSRMPPSGVQESLNRWAFTTFGKTVAAACEMFERSTRRYSRPEWRIESTLVGGVRVPVHVETVWERSFCNLVHFERVFEYMPRRPQPRLLIVAPLSGPLCQRCCAAPSRRSCPITTSTSPTGSMPAWSRSRRDASISDDYIDYIISILNFLGGDVHVVAVCQPSVPVMAAVALMEAQDDPYAPRSMVLMGGPIDTRINPTPP